MTGAALRMPCTALVVAIVAGAGTALGATVDVGRYARCDGTTDDTDALRAALHDGAGGSVRVPAGCLLLLRSPGAGGTSLILPSHTTLSCEPGAALVLARRRCAGGAYPGAACRVDGDCLGGSICGVDGGLAEEYAPDAAATYGVVRAAPRSTDVAVVGCRVRVHGADDFLRCVGGRNDRKPCEQYCDAGPLADLPCEDDGPCGAGHTCVNRADCAGAGGTCTGEPGRPSGPGRIDVLDLSGAAHATVERAVIADHRQGDVSIAVGDFGVVADNDTLATVDPRPGAFPRPEVARSFAVATAVAAADTARVTGNTLRAFATVVRTGGYASVRDNVLFGTGPATVGVYVAGGQHARIVANQVGAYTCVSGDPLHVTNVTVLGNRCLGGKGAKIVITGAGWTVADNYLAWGSGNGEPVIRVGSAETIGAAATHAVISGNILFSDQPDTTLIGFADPGKRCTGGQRSGRACAAGGDCPGGGCAPTAHTSGIITGNLFYRGAAGQTGIDLAMGGSPGGDTTIRGWGISANQFAANDVGIRLPRSPGLVTGTSITGNGFTGITRSAVENWSWTSGTLVGNGPLDAATDAVTVVWLKNGNPDAAVPGDAVEVDPALDDGFRQARSPHAIGVVLDAPAPGATGQIAVRGTTRCNLDGTPVSRGNVLAVSAMPGKLAPAVATAPAVAIALGAGTTSVRCLVGS